MKTLCLIRHAKSSWEDPLGNDLDRPLDSRGERDVLLIANLLKEKHFDVDYILTSHAVRAKATSEAIAQVLNYPLKKIHINEEIYEGGVEDLLAVIQEIPNSVKYVILVGHNPGLTWLANYLADDHVVNLPTCGVYCVSFDTDQWQEITEVDGKTLFIDAPANHVE